MNLVDTGNNAFMREYYYNGACIIFLTSAQMRRIDRIVYEGELVVDLDPIGFSITPEVAGVL